MYCTHYIGIEKIELIIYSSRYIIIRKLYKLKKNVYYLVLLHFSDFNFMNK